MLKTARFSIIVSVCFLLSTFAGVVRGAEMQVLRGHVPNAVKALQQASRLPGANRLNFAICLPLRNTDALTDLLGDIYNPASPNYRHFLTSEQFAAQFGPTETDAQVVADFAKANGFTVTKIHPNRTLVDVSASVADVEKAFNVTMHTYQHPTENRTFFAPDVEPSLALSVPISRISGLDNYSLPKPHYKFLAKTNQSNTASNLGTGSGANGSFAGADFRAAYVPDTTLTGTGQSVGLLQFDGYSAIDIATYETVHGLPSVTLTNVLLDGFSGNPTGNGGEVEVSLDIEMCISMAPGLSKIIVYEAGPSGNWHDILNRMATDNLAHQLSCSWYIPNGPADTIADGIFQQMAAQGQSFFNASGDDDAYSGLISFPGDTPYITQVGGTTLTTTGPGGSRVSETVWNRGNGIGSGGGISTQYSIPIWQTNISMALNQGSTVSRNVPDVALTAENVDVRADGTDFNVGGTSCAAPLWAGFAALVNQQAALSGQAPVGFINPALDAIGTKSLYTLRFNDITTGNNTNSGSRTKFIAATGYDLCTGWGTPSGQNLINALANPEPLFIQPIQGFAAIGGVGGPFSVSAQSLSLTNTGTNALNWTLSNTASWLNASPASGSLTNGGAAVIVNVRLNTAASNLTVGTYTTTLWFTNLNDNVGQGIQYSLTIINPPVITTQPTNTAVLDGATSGFSAVVTGGQPLFYQWRINGTNLTDNTNIFGSTSTALTITNTSTNNVGTYSLLVSNAAGTTLSSNAVLSLIPSAPVITQQPVGQTVFVGTTVQFSVNALGTKPLFYQWTLNGGNLSGGTNATLTLPNVQTNQSGNYAVLIYNSVSLTASSNALLTVNPLPPCDPPPAGLVSWWQGENNAQDVLGLDNGVSPTGSVTYGPGKIGQAFQFLSTGSSIPLGNPTNLWLQNFTFEAWVARNSSAIVSNGVDELVFGGGNGNYGFGVKSDGRLFLTRIGYDNVTVLASVNDTNWHHVAVTKSDSTVIFYLDGVAYPAAAYNPGFSFGSGFALGARGDNQQNNFIGAIDELAVYNRALTGSEVQFIYIVGGKCPISPTIVSQPASETINQGHSALFAATAAGSQPISYQWFFNSTNVVAGATNASLFLQNVQSNQSGNYAVRASNGGGSVLSSNAMLALGSGVQCDPQPTGLVDWWRAEANALDSGSTNNGVLVGGVSYVQGMVGQAFLFTGGDGSGVQVGTSAALNVQTFTIEAWIQRTGSAIFSGGEDEVIFGGGDDGYAFGLTTDGYLFLTKLNDNDVKLTTTIADTNWHHVAVTKTGSAVVFYIDGNPYSAGAYDPGFNNSANFAIGARGNDLRNAFLGSIDELTFYSRSLAAVEIQQIYSAASGGKCPLPPAIVTQPFSQTISAASNATFTVVATGTATLVYQWAFNSTNLIIGATNATLTLTNVQPTNAGIYSVTITNLYGMVVSSNAVLTVVTHAPAIVSQPASQTIGATSNVTFSVVATGTPLLAYQWMFNGSNVIAGATNPALVLNNVQPTNAGIYSVTITNLYGTIISSNAVLTVLTHAPAITLQPANQTIDAGSNAIFAVTATGTPLLGYQWMFNGSNLIAGATNPTLVLNNVQPGNAGLYSVTITNFYGTLVSSNATLVVLTHPPIITSQPSNVVAYAGFAAGFSAVATGTQPLSYQWKFNGTNISGATNTALNFAAVQSTNAGTYSLTVTNLYGAALSSNATLTVFPGAQCDAPPSGIVSWWKAEGNALDAAKTNNGVLTNGVTYVPGKVGQAFMFTGSSAGVKLGNPTNLQLQSFTIEMWIQRTASAITANGNDETMFCGGNNCYGFGMKSSGQLFLTQVGNGAATITNGVGDTNWHHVAVTKVGTAVMFYIDGVAYSGGTYNVTFTFGSGFAIGSRGDNLQNGFFGAVDEPAFYNRGLSASELQLIYESGAVGKCIPPVAFTTQPVSQSVMTNCTASFTVSASSSSPVGYQWWKNGVVVPGQTNATLSFASVQSSNFGTYFATATNFFGGSASSSNAVLALDHAPVATSDTVHRFASGGVVIPVSLLLTNDTDADGDMVSITGVSSTTAGNGTVSLQGNLVYYTPAAGYTNLDFFTYTITDGHCNATATGFVTVQVQPDNTPAGTYAIHENTGGSISLTFSGGIPNRSYRVQYTGSLSGSNWQDLTNLVSDGFGAYTFTDNPPTNSAARYYRAISP